MNILSKKQVATIFLMALIPFTIYTFIRPELRGFDSYAFLTQACGQFEVIGTPLIANAILTTIPCNIIAIKGVLFLLFFATLLGIGSLGELFHKEKGWLAALFSFLSPILLFEATKFENDQFATPILIWATYFFYKARITKQKKYDLICLSLLIIASQIWQGTIYFLLAFAISSFIIAIPGILATILYFQKLISSTLPSNLVTETQPIAGLAMLWGLSFGFSLLPLMMYPQAAIFLLLMVLQIKFAWFIAPLLSVGILLFYTNQKLANYKIKTHNIGQVVQGSLLTIAIAGVVVWGFALSGHPPHSYTWEAVEYAIDQSPNGKVFNDWDLGYFIIHKDGTPSQYGGGRQYAFSKGIVITKKEQPSENCQLLKQFNKLLVYDCHQ